MSNWTHVVGIIRVDRLRLLQPDKEPDFDEIIGKELLYTDSMNVWEDQLKNPHEYMPTGSEGSLQKHIWVNPDTSNLCAYTISVFGDLRDHDDNDQIIIWFIEICSRCNTIGMVRDACITSRNEMNGVESWTYGNESNYELKRKGKRWYVLDKGISRYILVPDDVQDQLNGMKNCSKETALHSVIKLNPEWLYYTANMTTKML